MTILPLDPAANATPEALHGFLEQCRAMAQRDRCDKLVSITLQVDALDPLAVLESIFEPDEPHFYAERPSIETAIAGAEVATMHTGGGPGRFVDAQRWIDSILVNTIAVGDTAAPFGGPHFFSAFTFFDEVEPGEPFPAATVFVPRWQVARAKGVTTAVANILISPAADLTLVSERLWRAHGKFRDFKYGRPPRHQQPRATAQEQSAFVGKKEKHAEDAHYRAVVTEALAEIAAGVFSKIVLARLQETHAPEALHPLEMLNGLRQRFSDCYSYSYTLGKGPSFIGASPERLVRVSKGVLETEALAGSTNRGTTASEDAVLAAALLASDKDRREQQQVIDDIVGRLVPLGFKPEFSEQPQLRRLANVQHLHTAIRAALPAGVRLLEVLEALHPTCAVGGTPRRAALARIRGMEGFSRGLYAGALGWINARGGGEIFVGLRSALIEGANAKVYAGAGIVAGSTPEKELAETELKFKAMLGALLKSRVPRTNRS